MAQSGLSVTELAALSGTSIDLAQRILDRYWPRAKQAGPDKGAAAAHAEGSK
jgi:hypothetical protein